MGQECGYLPCVPFVGTVQNSNGKSYIFAYKESIVFANGTSIIFTVQNSYSNSYVFAYKEPLKGPKLLTSF
jgi:hypothetical protein